MNRWPAAMLVLISSVWASSQVEAQGLLWDLPADGSWVRFEGTYTQVEIRPETPTGKLEIPAWTEHLWIRSVGSQLTEVDERLVRCRWIEIKVERGREKDGSLDSGLTGLEIFKILVPESSFTGAPRDKSDVPVSMQPVVKGWRKVGEQDAKPLPAGALQLYPFAVLLGYYRDVTVSETLEDLDTPRGSLSVKTWSGKSSQERNNSRTIQESTVFRHAETPFGVAGWNSRVTRELKNEFAPREDFAPLSEVVVEMRLAEVGEDAQSELIIEESPAAPEEQ